MNNAELKKLNKITFIMNMVVDELQLIAFKPHMDAYLSNPENHPYLLEIYGRIEKVVKEND